MWLYWVLPSISPHTCHSYILPPYCSTQILSRAGEDSKEPGDTNVSVQLFDAPPMTFTVPGDIPWTDPKFSEVVAQEALDRYKQTTV